MKDEWVIERYNYPKLALLRALSSHGATRIGVCWMRTPRIDGAVIDQFLPAEALEGQFLPGGAQYHCRHDAETFEPLAAFLSEPKPQRLSTIAESGIIPGAIYHDDMVPRDPDERAAYMAGCWAKFADADLVFFDPDWGTASRPKHPGQPDSVKQIYPDEVLDFYREGKSVLVYRHRRINMPYRAAVLSALIPHTLPDAAKWVYVSKQATFFLAIHPDSRARLATAAIEACRRWEPKFLSGNYLGAGEKPAQLIFNIYPG